MDSKEAKKGFEFKAIHAVLIVIVVAAVIAAVYFVGTSNAAPAVVADGDNVSVYYTGSFTNGTVFSTNIGQQPFNFTVGAGEVIQGFDQAVIGMSAGQNKTVTIPPQEGYGLVNQSLIVTVPLTVFGNSTVSVGAPITASDGDGGVKQGVVTSINGTNATVNFNSPLAGKTLVFTIRVVTISK